MAMKWFTPFRTCALCLLLLVVFAYSDHFHNDFHFDDDHTILNNIYVRKLSNIPLFFKSATTFSALPLNQTYRPMLTALYAFAYHFGGGNNVFFFHFFIFCFYLLQGFLLYLLIIRIFDLSLPQNAPNKYFALFTAGWYMLNTANADTINYISSASDSISTFWVIAAMVIYIYKPQRRKYFLYLIPVIIGVLFKQSALAFAGLLPAYIFLFESGEDGFLSRIKKTVLASIPALVLSAGLYELQSKLTSSTYITGGKPFNYIITQPFVMLHYFANFFFPTSLSADSDWVPFDSIADYRFWIGIAFLVLLGFAVIRLVMNKRNAPIAFGLLWFVISLLPSSLVPLSEVMNDYRPFFAYVGVAIIAGWCIMLIWQKWIVPNGQYVRLFALAMVLLLLGNTYGTYARNKVWATEDSLWLDVTEKSPMNGRGLMNYGLTLMAKADYAGAEDYFTRGLKLLPMYPYLYSNMGVLKAAEKKDAEADSYFKTSITYGQGIPVMYYFYARFLHQHGRDAEALPYVKQAIQLSPADVSSRYLAMEIYQATDDFADMVAMAKETLNYVPGDKYAEAMLLAALNSKSKIEQAIETTKQNPTPENYLNLSLTYFDKKDFAGCIEACKEAIKLNPKYAAAYNNMGSAYNNMGEWALAAEALKQAIALQPDFVLAQNNYKVAIRQQTLTDSIMEVVHLHPTADNYINLSLFYYGQGLFQKSVDACKEVIKIDPANSTAYNNMCAAYNNLQLWDDAIAAGERAVELAPNSQLAKNNLATAKQGKVNAGK